MKELLLSFFLSKGILNSLSNSSIWLISSSSRIFLFLCNRLISQLFGKTIYKNCSFSINFWIVSNSRQYSHLHSTKLSVNGLRYSSNSWKNQKEKLGPQRWRPDHGDHLDHETNETHDQKAQYRNEKEQKRKSNRVRSLAPTPIGEEGRLHC